MSALRKTFLACGLLIAYSPTLILLFAAFNDNRFLGNDYRGLTLRWLLQTLDDSRFLDSLGSSLLTSLVVGASAAFLGAVLSLTFLVGSRWIRACIGGALVVTFLTPPTAYALNLLLVVRWIGLDKGWLVTCVGQTVYALPAVVALFVLALREVNWDRFEAAVLLGARPLYALYRFVFLEVRGVLLSGFLVAVFFSLDDLVMGVYLSQAGDEPSITRLVWQAMRSDLSPVVAWYSITLTVAGTAVAVILGRILAKRSRPSLDREKWNLGGETRQRR